MAEPGFCCDLTGEVMVRALRWGLWRLLRRLVLFTRVPNRSDPDGIKLRTMYFLHLLRSNGVPAVANFNITGLVFFNSRFFIG